MIKFCDVCGGLGYEEFDTSDPREDEIPMYIDVICDNCQGEGFVEIKCSKFFVKIYQNNEVKSKTYLEIETTMNRPNNPDYIEIIETWVMYNYGVNTFDLEEIEERVEISQEWNIENYR